MARRKNGGPNKSELIRQFVKTNKRAKPKQIQEGLRAQGHDVSIQLISNVKNTTKRKKGGRKAADAVSTNGHASSLKEVMALLLAARKLVEQAGSAATARKAIDAVAKL